MPHFITTVGATVLCGRTRIDQIDSDRIAAAERMVSERHCSPLAAHLIACRGWQESVARAYSLVGSDAAAIISRQDALAHGRARKVFQ